MNKKAVKLLPAFKDYLWGGTRLKEEYNKNSDLDIVAESWERSTHIDGQSIIEATGQKLEDYIKEQGKEILGKNALAFEFFPILIKFIDAKGSLSVQVHPSDEYALRVEGEYGKTEMWYILDCEEGACLYYGLKSEMSKEEFKKHIEDETLEDILNKVEVKKGDVFFIEAGTIHAIGAGIVICEIQQNSNTTYRVYDYGRRDKYGNLRELHVDKAIEVSNLCPPPPTKKADVSGDCILASCKYFTVRAVEVDGEKNITMSSDCFNSVIVTDGEGTLYLNGDTLNLKKGDSIFIPAQDAEYKIQGKLNTIISYI